MNNGDGNIRYEALVDLAQTTASPVALVAPIVDCPVDALCQFTVPAADPDAQPLAWRLSTSAEAGGFTQPPGASIDPATGLYSWDTTGAALAPSGSTFYSTQVMVENVVGGNVISRSAVDFFIRLGSNSANQQPILSAPTPADGEIIPATVGAPLTVNVAASDPDAGDNVSTSVLGLPAGATYTPTNGNPASGVLAWTPTTPGDYPVTFTAQDQLGLGATPRGAIIRVAQGQTNPAPVVDAGSNLSGNVGEPISLDGTISDTEPVTSTWSDTPGADVAPGASCSFADATLVDTTVTCTGTGTWTLTLTADDGTNPAVSDTTTLTVVAPKTAAQIQCETAKAQGPGTFVDGRKVVLGTGGSGNQIVLSADDGNTTLKGGSGDDLLCAWGGNNILRAGSGNDVLIVLDGTGNKLFGESGDDLLIGFATDSFDGGTGKNTITKK